MYRILLVEDDEALRYVYARMNAWQENGFCLAAQAANGKQALEQLDKERFDLIVTDIRMPFVDGLAFWSAPTASLSTQGKDWCWVRSTTS